MTVRPRVGSLESTGATMRRDATAALSRGAGRARHLGRELAEEPEDPSTLLGMHREEVEDVRPILAALVAVAHETGGNLVAVGLIEDERSPEIVPSFRRERLEECPEVGVVHAWSLDGPPGSDGAPFSRFAR